MERHVNLKHGKDDDSEVSHQDVGLQVTDDEAEDNSSNDNEEDESEDGDDSEDKETSESSSDTSSDEDDEESSIWEHLWQEAWTETLLQSFRKKKEASIDDGWGNKDAHQHAYMEVLPKLRRNIFNLYTSRWLQEKEMRKDPIHKKIDATKRKLMLEEDYDPEEAMHYAVKKRRYLIQEATGTQSDDELSESFDMESEDEEDEAE
jgi:hypothetical protein